MLHRNPLAAVIALALAFASAGCQSMTPAEARARAHERWDRVRAEIKMQQACQHYDAGLFDDAERTATEAISLDPTLTESYVVLARANLELGKATSAMRAIEMAREAGLASPALTYMYGVVLEQRGRLEEAVTAYATACQTDPNNVDYVIAHAESLVALGRPEEAMAQLAVSIGRFDDDGSVILLSAHIAALLGNEEDAIRRYRLAIEALGESPIATRELGTLLVRAGRCEEAISRLAPLLAGDRDDSYDMTVRLPLAEAYLETGRPLLARQLLSEVNDPERGVAAYTVLAKAALATGDELEAKRVTTAGLRLDPDDAQLALLQATALWRLGEPRAAEGHLTDYTSRHPDDPTGFCLLAEVLRSQGHAERASDMFYRALKLDPDNHWAKRGLEAMEQVSYADPIPDPR